jgi:hypothetical protein
LDGLAGVAGPAHQRAASKRYETSSYILTGSLGRPFGKPGSCSLSRTIRSGVVPGRQ